MSFPFYIFPDFSEIPKLIFLSIFSNAIRRRQWHPTPVLLPGKCHGQRSLVGCSPWGRKELDATERLHFHFSLSYVAEGNGNLLQCSCLENPREWGAWWAAVYGVAQSRTRLKRLSRGSNAINSYLYTGSLGLQILLRKLPTTNTLLPCRKIGTNKIYEPKFMGCKFSYNEKPERHKWWNQVRIVRRMYW